MFTTSGFALADLGRRDLVMLAWGIGGVLAMCGALSSGALARRIPESGGEYTLLSRTVHPLAGLAAGWVSLLAGFTAPIAAAALALQAYLGPSFAGLSSPEWIGTAAILAAGLMHGLRLREGVILQNLAVGLMLLVIAALLILGALWGTCMRSLPAPPTFSNPKSARLPSRSSGYRSPTPVGTRQSTWPEKSETPRKICRGRSGLPLGW